MDAADMRRRLVSARVGHLGTAGPRPHVVPVCYVLVADTAFTAVDHKPKRSARLRRIANVEATGWACLLVDEYHDDWTRLWWVRIDGPARMVDDAGEAARAIDALAAKYPQYAQRRPSGPVLALEAERWSGWQASG
ncbi:MAG TPA: TIGR03668 family PPOX class F420-dependent oxidoreductase [Jatrophihabitantaceae bacterium]|jgi:PPOX class probable F420-dependent enzyme